MPPALPMSTRRRIGLQAILFLIVGCGASGEGDNASEANEAWHLSADSSAEWIVGTDGGCTDCIDLGKLFAVGDTTKVGFVEEATAAVRDSSGRYWIGQRGHIKVYGPTGELIRSLGRTGMGPGEFQRPMPTHTDASGGVHVIDPANGRETLFSPDFSIRRETRLPFLNVFSLAALEDGDSYVANLWIGTAQAIGMTLHIVRRGTVVRSFGPPIEQRPMTMFESERVVAADDDGRAFAVERFQFHISVFSQEGRPIARIVGPALNAASVTGPVLNLRDNPIPNEIVAMRLQEPHRLWLLSRRVRDNWRSFVVEKVRPDGTLGIDPRPGMALTLDSLFFSRLEVVDLRARRIISRQEFGAVCPAFIGDDRLLCNASAPDGTPTIEIWRFGLRAK